jgi:aryl-alcohol dehydrogenase
VPERLELARELGATNVVDANEVDVAESLATITGGVDGVIETTGNTTVLRTGVDALAARGTLVIVGAPPFGTEVALDVNGMLGGKHVVGITLGDSEPQTFIPTLVELVRSGRLPVHKLIRHYAVEDIDTAAHDMATGKTITPVLTFGA